MHARRIAVTVGFIVHSMLGVAQGSSMPISGSSVAAHDSALLVGRLIRQLVQDGQKTTSVYASHERARDEKDTLRDTYLDHDRRVGPVQQSCPISEFSHLSDLRHRQLSFGRPVPRICRRFSGCDPAQWTSLSARGRPRATRPARRISTGSMRMNRSEMKQSSAAVGNAKASLMFSSVDYLQPITLTLRSCRDLRARV